MNHPINSEFKTCIDKIPNGSKILDKLDILPICKKYIENIEFKNINNSLFYYIPNIKLQNYIAAFDMDWTLSYSEKHLYPKDPDDVKLLPNRQQKMIELFKLGYTIVIVTNQYAKSKTEKQKKLDRVANLVKLIGIPCCIFIATEKDEYRKPDKMSWTILEKYIPNIKYAFYVGDALGRKQDFSDSDKQFADSIGILIYAPEDFFSHDIPTFNPDKNMVIFVGMPGSGKTNYYNNVLKPLGYFHVNQDQLKTRQKVLSTIKSLIKEKKSMVIDSTNPERQFLYDIAQENGYSISVVYFVRNGTGWNKLRENKVPDIVYHVYFKKLIPPTVDNTPGNLYLVD